MLKMTKNFILKIRNSDDATKKLWLVVLSGATMAIVIALWVVYQNLSIAKVDYPKSPEVKEIAVATKNNESDGPGFFAIFGAGLKNIYDQIKAKLSLKNNIIIENRPLTFISKNVEPIKPTKLR